MQGGGSIGVCLNSDAASGGVCPGDFVCEDTEPVDLCDGVSCASDEYCDSATGDCVERGGGDNADPDCPVCFACDSDADCSGATCLPINGGVCAVDCETSDDCPGNTQCFEIPDGATTISACLNEDAASAGVCPGSFICDPSEDGGGDDGGGGDGTIIDEGSDDSGSGSATLECTAANAPAAPFGLLLIAGAAILSRRRRAA
jgi:MYXO-CTERM domain-containing protein